MVINHWRTFKSLTAWWNRTCPALQNQAEALHSVSYLISTQATRLHIKVCICSYSNTEKDPAQLQQISFIQTISVRHCEQKTKVKLFSQGLLCMRFWKPSFQSGTLPWSEENHVKGIWNHYEPRACFGCFNVKTETESKQTNSNKPLGLYSRQSDQVSWVLPDDPSSPAGRGDCVQLVRQLCGSHLNSIISLLLLFQSMLETAGGLYHEVRSGALRVIHSV